MRLIISLGLVILLSSCVGTTNNYYTSTIKSWRGGNTNALVQAWGTPDTKIVNPNGSTVYIYKTKGYAPTPATTTSPVGVNVSRTGRPVIVTSPAPTGQPSTSSVGCIAVFEAAANGKIYNTEVRGKGCYANLDFVNTMSNPGTIKKSP
jgi:hypothetical protein